MSTRTGQWHSGEGARCRISLSNRIASLRCLTVQHFQLSRSPLRRYCRVVEVVPGYNLQMLLMSQSPMHCQPGHRSIQIKTARPATPSFHQSSTRGHRKAQDADQRGDYIGLHRAVGLKPWEPSPFDIPVGNPYPKGRQWEQAWETVTGLSGLLAEAMRSDRIERTCPCMTSANSWGVISRFRSRHFPARPDHLADKD